MSEGSDDGFRDRADAHIRLSNEQLEASGAGWVSASMLYAAARFNVWLSASEATSADHMREMRPKVIAFFEAEYSRMLAENMDEYIAQFDTYMKDRH